MNATQKQAVRRMIRLPLARNYGDLLISNRFGGLYDVYSAHTCTQSRKIAITPFYATELVGSGGGSGGGGSLSLSFLEFPLAETDAWRFRFLISS